MEDSGVDSTADSDSDLMMTILGWILVRILGWILWRILGWILKMNLEWILGGIFCGGSIMEVWH